MSSQPQVRQDVAQATTPLPTGNQSRVVSRALTQNHSRAVSRAHTSDLPRAASRGDIPRR